MDNAQALGDAVVAGLIALSILTSVLTGRATAFRKVVTFVARSDQPFLYWVSLMLRLVIVVLLAAAAVNNWGHHAGQPRLLVAPS